MFDYELVIETMKKLKEHCCIDELRDSIYATAYDVTVSVDGDNVVITFNEFEQFKPITASLIDVYCLMNIMYHNRDEICIDGVAIIDTSDSDGYITRMVFARPDIPSGISVIAISEDVIEDTLESLASAVGTILSHK